MLSVINQIQKIVYSFCERYIYTCRYVMTVCWKSMTQLSSKPKKKINPSCVRTTWLYSHKVLPCLTWNIR